MTSTSLMHEAGHPKPVRWDNAEGWCGEGEVRGVQDGGTHVHLRLIHVDVWQKSLQCCNYPPVKINNFFQRKGKKKSDFLELSELHRISRLA